METLDEFRAEMVVFLRERIEVARAMASVSPSIGGRRKWHGAENALRDVLDFIELGAR